MQDQYYAIFPELHTWKLGFLLAVSGSSCYNGCSGETKGVETHAHRLDCP